MPLAERDRRALIIFGVVIAVALIAYFLLLKPKGGGEVVTEPTPTTTTTSPPPTLAPTTSAPVTPRTPPPSGFPLGGKDPFSPLVASGGGVGPTTTGPVTTVTGTNPFSTSPFSTTPASTTPAFTTSPATTPPSVSPPVSPTSTGTPGGTSTHSGGHTVTLIDIFFRNGTELVQVQVDSTAYTVSEGQTFATNFHLVSISGTCASFLHNGQQFLLCENPRK
jgi:hypothetical protein